MDKWADYLVSAVRYNFEHTRIQKVKVHKDDGGDKVPIPSEWIREQVVTYIRNGLTFITIVKNSAGKYTQGSEIHIVRVNGIDFLRTDLNQEDSDNLGSLPEF
jgi:hypothetical protein